MSDLQDALDYYDRTDHPPMPAVDPLVEAARLWSDHQGKCPLLVTAIESDVDLYPDAAALTPGDTDNTKWWEVEHHPRCNIEVLGAEPLQPGGDCTCAALTPGDTE